MDDSWEQHSWHSGNESSAVDGVNNQDDAETIAGYDALSVDPYRSHGFDVEDDESSSTMPSLTNGYTGPQYLWLCRACESPDWRRNLTGGWSCNRCGHDVFYDAFRASTFRSQAGRWTYVPDGHPTSSDLIPPPPVSPFVKHGDPGPPAAHGCHEAQAESETATIDPCVDPDTLLPRPSRRQRRAARRTDELQPGVSHDAKVCHSPQVQRPSKEPVRPKEPGTTGNVPASPFDNRGLHGKGFGLGKSNAGSDQPSTKNAAWRDSMLKDLHSLVSKDKEPKEWSPAKGPQPGVKFRGGTPPQPPQWTATKGDLQAFQRWERKLTVWRRQIASYLPANESAMLLYVQLQGEAAEELEHCDIERVDSASGVDYILETLRSSLMVKGIYLKRKFLDDFERLQRRNGETVKAFCNRYHRVERSLLSVGINTGNMYDAESAGSRLLDRLRLGIDAQRLILVATGQSLRYQDIKDAAEIQFPEHRQTPPVVYTRDFDRDDRGDRPAGAKDSNGKGNATNRSNTSAKGNQKGKPNHASAFVKKTYVTEDGNAPEDEKDETTAENEVDESHEPNAEYDEENGEQPVPNEAEDEDGECDDVWGELQEAARCLTVTARRLQGITLARKFSGGKTIAQRKAESHCAVCGQKGHWQGDAACSATPSKGSNPKGDGKSSKQSASPAATTYKPAGKKVMQVRHPDGSLRSVSFDDDVQKESFGTYFTYMVNQPVADIHQVFGASAQQFSEVLVLDTACQKSCCSSMWLDEKKSILNMYGLRIRTTPNREPFEFGHGPPQFSHEHALIPTCFDFKENHMMLLGASVISTTNNIPFLASSTLMSNKLKMVLNLPDQEAYIGLLDITVPICKVAGHLALYINQFPECAAKSNIWSVYHKMCHDPDLDSDLLFANADGSSKTKFADNDHCADEQGPSSTMAVQLEEDGRNSETCRDATSKSHGASSKISDPSEKVADVPGPNGHGGNRSHRAKGQGTMQTRDDAALRQQARQFRQVPPLREEVGVVPRGRKVERSTYAKAALAAIAIVLNGFYVPGEGSSSNLGTDRYAFDSNGPSLHSHIEELCEFSKSFSSSSAGPGHQHEGKQEGSQTEGFNQETLGNTGRGGGGTLGRKLGVRLGTPQQVNVKKGTQAWLTGHLRNVSRIYNDETKVYDSLMNHAKRRPRDRRLTYWKFLQVQPT